MAFAAARVAVDGCASLHFAVFKSHASKRRQIGAVPVRGRHRAVYARIGGEGFGFGVIGFAHRRVPRHKCGVKPDRSALV